MSWQSLAVHYRIKHRLSRALWPVGLILLVLPVWLSIALGAISIFFGLRLLLPAALRCTVRWVPSWTHGPLSAALGCVSAAGLYLARGGGWLGWIVLVAGIVGCTLAAGWILALHIAPLRAAYGSWMSKSLPHFAFVYVEAESWIGDLYACEILRRSRRFRSAMLVPFLSSECLKGAPREFRQWIRRHASAFVFIRAPFALLPLDDQIRTDLMLCAYSTFSVVVSIAGDTGPGEHAPADELLATGAKPDERVHLDVLGPVMHRLEVTSIPLRDSDAQMPPALRDVAMRLAASGLPPLADAYLRVRLAQSQVERFAALIDAVEVVLRCSVLVLHAGHSTELWARHDRPMMGTWVNWLEDYVALPGPLTAMAEHLRAFWAMCEVSASQAELIDLAAQQRLVDVPSQPLTQLKWIRWFAHFRNATRGHGVLEEQGVAQCWHALHRVFLELVAHVNGLALSPLELVGANEARAQLGGWVRNQHRSLVLNEAALAAPPRSVFSQSVELTPYCRVEGISVLLWASGVGANATFVDFRSGERAVNVP